VTAAHPVVCRVPVRLGEPEALPAAFGIARPPALTCLKGVAPVADYTSATHARDRTTLMRLISATTREASAKMRLAKKAMLAAACIVAAVCAGPGTGRADATEPADRSFF